MGYDNFDGYLIPFEEKPLLENHMTPEQMEIQNAIHDVQNSFEPPTPPVEPSQTPEQLPEIFSPTEPEMVAREKAEEAFPGILGLEEELIRLVEGRMEQSHKHIIEIDSEMQDRIDELHQMQSIHAGFRVIDRIQKQLDSLADSRRDEENALFRDTANMNIRLAEIEGKIDHFREDEEPIP